MLTINLLPPQEKETIRLERKVCLTVLYSVYFLVILVVFVCLLLVNVLCLKSKISATEKLALTEQENMSVQNMKNIKKEITVLNKTLETLRQLADKTENYSFVLGDLSQLMPVGVKLSNFSFDSKTKTVVLDGWAPERSQVLVLKEALEKSPKFSDVESPMANLLRQKDIIFRFSFVLK